MYVYVYMCVQVHLQVSVSVSVTEPISLSVPMPVATSMSQCMHVSFPMMNVQGAGAVDLVLDLTRINDGPCICLLRHVQP